MPSESYDPYLPNVQIIYSPSGEELVVISKADFDAMLAALDALEYQRDVETYDRRKAEMAAGDAG
ncbi:hypothetical protein ASD74_15035 [Rhizobium sp. Root564]|nr:hypothetical protein ASD74_15035 [Rhizobium sp. Root564]